MPRYNTAQALQDCNQGLDALFRGLQPSSELSNQVHAIKVFYRDNLEYKIDNYPEDTESHQQIIDQYQDLVSLFSSVKSGDLSKEEALKTIAATTNKRVNQVIINNILNVCQLLFWAAVVIGSYAVASTVGLSLLVIEPWLGALMVGSTFMTYLTGIYQFIDRCFDFQSSTPAYDEDTRYRDVISFFKPADRVVVVNAQPSANANPSGLYYEPLDTATPQL